MRVRAEGLDAYLAANPLVVGEPVRLDLGRQAGHEFEDGGILHEADGFRWVRDQRVAVAIVTWREIAGVSVVPTRAFGEPVELDECCRVQEERARVSVGGAHVELDPGCSTIAEGLTISNVSYLVYEDGGCCRERSGPVVTAVARP